MIRTLAFICYSTATPALRKEKAFPNPWQIQLDNRTFRRGSIRFLKDKIKENVFPLKEVDTGVYVVHFSEGEQRYAGANEINSWLGTLSATRLELIGSAAEAGKMDILTNFVTVTAINPAERTLQVGQGGWHPPGPLPSAVAASA
jgi:hypothetical protein